MDKEQILQHIKTISGIAAGIPGLITGKEIEFLSVVPLISAQGEILEIGSYLGKSTVVLAKSAQFAGMKQIFACDPFLLESPTDPNEMQKEKVEDMFFENLKNNDAEKLVVFNKMKSEELAKNWNSPIKVLWIDGDHTYKSVKSDFDNFVCHLVPGAVVCMHDVLHAFDGPVRVFSEQILLSDQFSDCGIVGSLGWAQYTGNRFPSKNQWRTKLKLYRLLSKMIPFIYRMNNDMEVSKLVYNFRRSMVPHGKPDLLNWLAER
jgi:MMP 1-O-methyltransferase